MEKPSGAYKLTGERSHPEEDSDRKGGLDGDSCRAAQVTC